MRLVASGWLAVAASRISNRYNAIHDSLLHSCIYLMSLLYFVHTVFIGILRMIFISMDDEEDVYEERDLRRMARFEIVSFISFSNFNKSKLIFLRVMPNWKKIFFYFRLIKLINIIVSVKSDLLALFKMHDNIDFGSILSTVC